MCVRDVNKNVLPGCPPVAEAASPIGFQGTHVEKLEKVFKTKKAPEQYVDDVPCSKLHHYNLQKGMDWRPCWCPSHR
jgi:hypothetical protein